jgi:hypothetical protein
MANDILIIPASASIQFSGSAANTIRLVVEDSGSVAFYGDSGSLFGISDSLSGSLMSVNDISGLPTLETFSDGKLVVSPYAFQVRSMGFGTDTPIGNFDFVNPLAENVDFYIRTTQGQAYDTALHIRGSRTTSTTDELANIRFETADTDAGGVEMARISAIKDVASTNIARLEFKTTSTDGGSPTTKMMISSSGNVGIGNTTPSHTLSVTGDISASGQVTASAFTGNTFAMDSGTSTISGSLEVHATASDGRVLTVSSGSGEGYIEVNSGNLWFKNNGLTTRIGSAANHFIYTNGSSLYPSNDSVQNLGLDSVRWKDLYVTNVSASGDVSASTFTGNTFTMNNGTSTISGSLTIANTGSTNDELIRMTSDVGSNTGSFHVGGGSFWMVGQNTQLRFATAGYNGAQFAWNGISLYPNSDGQNDLGYDTNYRWRTLYTTNVSASGDVSASTFTGDGSQITGVVSSSYAVTADSASYIDGLISFPNGLDVTGSLLVDGDISASGTITGSGFQMLGASVHKQLKCLTVTALGARSRAGASPDFFGKWVVRRDSYNGQVTHYYYPPTTKH